MAGDDEAITTQALSSLFDELRSVGRTPPSDPKRVKNLGSVGELLRADRDIRIAAARQLRGRLDMLQWLRLCEKPSERSVRVR